MCLHKKDIYTDVVNFVIIVVQVTEYSRKIRDSGEFVATQFGYMENGMYIPTYKQACVVK